MTSSKNGPWEQYLADVLRPKIERLRCANRFGAFHATLMKLAQAQVDFYRDNSSEMIALARSPEDLDAVTRPEAPAHIMRIHKIPWGWRELIAAMMVPSGRQHKTKSGIRRKISKKTARAFLLVNLTMEPHQLKKAQIEFKKDLQQKSGVPVEGDLSRPMRSGEAYVTLLDKGNLDPVSGDWIAKSYQAHRADQTGSARKAALQKKQVRAKLNASIAKRKHH